MHDNIVTTFFWVGETATAENAGISNAPSVWDENWQKSFGGVDSPTNRIGYLPSGFVPKENPFYFALPYNDITSAGKRKSTANLCPKVDQKNPYSWCKNSWIKITAHGKTTYAQWQDSGPLGEDDTDYVLGSKQPKNTFNSHAGLDVSPAVRDFLSLADVDKSSWQFIDEQDVPSGPWKNIITKSGGTLKTLN